MNPRKFPSFLHNPRRLNDPKRYRGTGSVGQPHGVFTPSGLRQRVVSWGFCYPGPFCSWQRYFVTSRFGGKALPGVKVNVISAQNFIAGFGSLGGPGLLVRILSEMTMT